MQKKEYVSPEMEIVEITEQNIIMASENPDGNFETGNPWGKSRRSRDDEEE